LFLLSESGADWRDPFFAEAAVAVFGYQFGVKSENLVRYQHTVYNLQIFLLFQLRPYRRHIFINYDEIDLN
jgi:hypothetical protein